MRSSTKGITAAIIILSIFFAGCHRGGSETKQVTPEEAKKNAEIEKTQPHLAPTALGSVERISLAVEALRYAGAKRYPFDSSGDFVWGRPVASFQEALPGDILQFRNAVFQGKRWISKRHPPLMRKQPASWAPRPWTT